MKDKAMNNVLHFVRKNTQLKASFINNQVTRHIKYKPAIIFKEYRTNPYDGGFADFKFNDYSYLDLSQGNSIIAEFRYKTIKLISNHQVKQILDFIDLHQIQICHFHFGTDCGIYSPLLKRLKIPAVVSFYGYDCSSFPKRFWGYGRLYLKSRVFSHIDKVIAMSPDMKHDLMLLGCPEDKIIVHYYGTDVQKFYFHDKIFCKKEVITLLNLCSLVPQKGQLFLLKSIKEIVNKGITNFSLRIVGTGELEHVLKKFVEINGLSKYVVFIGAIPYGGSEMVNEYFNADIFVHPSVVAPDGSKEGIPGTIIEAMAAALPVISTWHAGIPYIISHKETGLLVKENDVNSLTEELILLIKNIELRKKLGSAGQKLAISEFDVIMKETELEEIYDKLVK